MPFNALLLPLLGGYILITHWNHTRFHTKRYSGERLLFHAATAGVALLIASFVIVRLIIAAYPAVYTEWRAVVPFPYTGTSFGAFLLGCGLPWPMNRLSSREKAHAAAIIEWGDYLEVLLEKALREFKLVAVTLKNGKFYVGWVTQNFDPGYERKYIRFLPLKSGHRDPVTHAVIFTTDYFDVYEELNTAAAEVQPRVVPPPRGLAALAGSWLADRVSTPSEPEPSLEGSDREDDFLKVVPVSEIASANLFDFDIYDKFIER